MVKDGFMSYVDNQQIVKILYLLVKVSEITEFPMKCNEKWRNWFEITEFTMINDKFNHNIPKRPNS